MSILGNAVVRREDPGFLTGSAAYVDDLLPENALYLAYVRSPYAHARITAVDVDEAVAAPGVAGVFTGVDVAVMGLAPNVLPMFPDAMKRPYVAADVVRYAGQPVVAVVAETQAQAVDAAELVIVDYEPLAPVIDPETAVRDEVLIFGNHGTNILSHMESPTAADFSECKVVVSERIVNQRLTAAPIEGRTGIAYWTHDGRLVHYSAVQGAHPTRDLLANIYGLAPANVRVVVPDVGGGFGAYPLIAGVLAGMTQRMATGTYDLTNVGFSADVVVTNTVPLTAYRGAGRPEAAAELLEAAVDDIVLDTEGGVFHVVGTPTRTASWTQVATAFPDGVEESADFTAPQGTFPNDAHVAVVEVDPETGGTTLVRLVAADDAGTLIDPLLAEGHVHGGIAQGVAQALLEGIQYDDDGNLLTGNFMDYLVISAAELPSFEVVHIETPTWVNELGAKGVGESGTIGAIPAVYNAVVDAVSHLGVRHLTTPITPQQLCEAIAASRIERSP
ncbi:xanthine dehydrogenase family protein molybdopterin-binding subunit [Candidatus Poriferisodalis sp.]|uniref:xanthine dehydrogenase family protein molybdopterin-binding subunit n=1 Tax=Candidatus Poriferisodalis sp. TaxID=3101277 RepID=UPI003B011407